MTSHQHHQREQTTMTSQWNTPSNPDLRFASESESGFTTNLNLDSIKSNTALDKNAHSCHHLCCATTYDGEIKLYVYIYIALNDPCLAAMRLYIVLL